MAVQSDIATRRTQGERRAEAEEALLTASAELFAEHGILQTSLAQIGERAGYSRGLVNHHFGTKDVLIEHLAQRCQNGFWDAVARIDVGTGLEGVFAITEVYLDRLESPNPFARAFLVMWGAALPGASGADAIAEADERSRAALTSWIEIGQRDGSISRNVIGETIAVVLLGVFRGVAAQVLIAPDAIDVGALRSQCHALVQATLSPTAQSRSRHVD